MSDLIDRQAAIDAMQKLIITDDEESLMLMEYNQAVTDCIDKVAELPPVTPAEKVGRWTTQDTVLGKCCVCSECGGCPNIEYRYCPYCGAKMQASPTGEEVDG